MRQQSIETFVLDNGLTLVVETMPDVQSAAYSLLVPGGSVYEPSGQNGTAAILSDWISRGAGDLDSRELMAAYDNLGIQSEESPGLTHQTFSGACLAGNLAEALRLTGDIVRRPHLPEDQFEAAHAGIEQALRGNEDDPRHKSIQELRRRCYRAPWGLPSDGSLDDLPRISSDAVREHFQKTFRPNGAILGVAGKVDAREVFRTVRDVFDTWEQKPEPAIVTGPRGPQVDHIQHDSTQLHIGIAYDAVPYRDKNYYAAWAAVNVLSGGMSSRLFTEVREKRGLCYSVYASLNSLRNEARVLCYAGTTAERAQETLDVTLAELIRLEQGIEVEELERCKARAKSSLVMQQESTMSRSSSIARDWFHLGRVVTLEEVRGKIDELTVDAILQYVGTHRPRDFTVLTIGPHSLEVRFEVP